MPDPKNIVSVLEHLYAHGKSPDLGDKWGHLQPDPDCRLLDTDGKALWESLEKKYHADDLVAAGVAVRDEGGLRLTPQLTTDDRLLVFLRGQDGQLVDLLTSRSVSSVRTLRGQVAWLAACQAKPPSGPGHSAEDPRRIFFVSSMEEIVLLRSLGLPAVAYNGLNRLTQTGLWRLQCVMDGKSPPRQRSLDHPSYGGQNCPTPCELILVACDVCKITADIAERFYAVAKHLTDAAQYMDFDWDALHVWHPSSEELGKLDYQRRVRCGRQVYPRFFGDLQCLYGVEHFTHPEHPEQLRRPHDSFAEKFERIVGAELKARRENRPSYDAREYRSAADDYSRYIQRKIVEPVLESAECPANPSQRIVRLQLAQVARLLQLAMPRLHVAQSEWLAEPYAQEGFLPEETWKQTERLMDRVEKLIRQDQQLTRAKRLC